MNIFLYFMYHQSFEGSMSLGTPEGTSLKSNSRDVCVFSFIAENKNSVQIKTEFIITNTTCHQRLACWIRYSVCVTDVTARLP